ncbi:hypothetical protein [Shewanella litorisediminis]|uniref:Uncharacterized protein n=1 Tax=Shewanella litorisediminis TaxID=1173586 RepID=A0ABX7FYZ4_9GAMM|nr:hypothetical protein [Shewanella litorisediminis]MCL2918778.1 hypothetical protein [Shewanella litorisediminis]QRH00253.1 hypothetical protein JQC75_10050 [Shewanella litorisediminis]
MHYHLLSAHCLKLASCLTQDLVAIDTDVKHLTLIRINSGREEANSPK